MAMDNGLLFMTGGPKMGFLVVGMLFLRSLINVKQFSAMVEAYSGVFK